jgi:hypothetical protein
VRSTVIRNEVSNLNVSGIKRLYNFLGSSEREKIIIQSAAIQSVVISCVHGVRFT